MYGDNKHLPNVYASLMILVKSGIVIRNGEHLPYYSLASDDVEMSINVSYKSENVVTHRKTKENIPKPTNYEVDYWLKVRDSLPDYTIQEEAINELFQSQYNSYKSLKNIIIKCSVLNDFYSTNVFKVYLVAFHILELDINERLKQRDISLVNEIANNKIANREENFYLFASKCCSHHNQEEFQIYDFYVDQMLRHFRNADGFVDFDNKDLKD